jgi:hypothetical protein
MGIRRFLTVESRKK